MTHDLGRKARYAHILRASAVVGGASLLTVVASILRGKITAVLLGPAGVGLMGLYGSILDLVQGTTGLGLSSGGVRQIAAAAAAGSADKIARTVVALRTSAALVAGVGACLTVVASAQIAQWTFGRPDYAVWVAVLSIAVAFRALSDGEAALLQGLRRMEDIARVAIFSAMCGTAITCVLVWRFRELGIVPALVGAAAATAAITTYHSRRATAPLVRASIADGLAEAAQLFKIGGAFLVSAALTVLGAYLVRRTVRDSQGLTAAGLYQAAWTLGGTYVGFVLQAMGTDFYPRLTGTVGDDAACNAMVNEQAHVSVLLAGPGVAATLALAPIVLAVFYHSTFNGAVEPLRWISLGMLLRVVSWPMGFIILARGATGMFIAAEVAAFAVHLGLALWLTPVFGVTGAAMAFAGLYAWHACFVYVLVRRMTGFRWAPVTLRSAATVIGLVLIAFVSSYTVPWPWSLVVQLATTAGAGLYSLRQITSALSVNAVPPLLRKRMKACGPV